MNKIPCQLWYECQIPALPCLEKGFLPKYRLKRHKSYFWQNDQHLNFFTLQGRSWLNLFFIKFYENLAKQSLASSWILSANGTGEILNSNIYRGIFNLSNFIQQGKYIYSFALHITHSPSFSYNLSKISGFLSAHTINPSEARFFYQHQEIVIFSVKV